VGKLSQIIRTSTIHYRLDFVFHTRKK